VLGLAAAHFALALATGMMAHGIDFDQLRSRSALSRAAGPLHDALMLPHGLLLRALPRGAILRPGVVPAALFGHSVAWGMALFLLARAVRPRR
jgi:hypothetical protein